MKRREFLRGLLAGGAVVATAAAVKAVPTNAEVAKHKTIRGNHSTVMLGEGDRAFVWREYDFDFGGSA